jgi:diguanylate cyclase (GGDEF)-like protein/PAS domain S-box-containing protein
MTLTAPLHRNRRFLAEWLFLLGALLALGGYVGYLQHQEYRQIETQERERLVSQVAVIEKNLTPQLLLANRVINGVLNDLPSWRAAHDGFKGANRQLQIINDAMIGIRPILVIQADGKVIASSDEKLVGMNFAQREYFQTAIKNPDPRILHISAPFKTVLDTFVISLFRPISGPNGEFAGIVIVSAIPEYFSILLDSIRYSPDMLTFIIHGDGKLFLISPQKAGVVGMDMSSPGSFFTRHRESGKPVNVLTGIAAASGEERMTALRTIQLTTPPTDKPLVVAVSRNLDAIFAPWRKNLYVQITLFGVMSIFSILGLLITQKRRRAQFSERKQAEDRIRDLLREQRLIFDNAHVGILMVKRRQVVKCNRRQAEMFGYAGPEEIEGKSVEMFFCSQKEFKEVGDRLYALMAQHGFAQGEVEMCRQDGKRIWIMMAGRPLDPAAVLDGSIWVYTDITERRQAETERRIAATAFESQEGMMITDTHGMILRVNHAFTEITGYTAAEVIGQSPRLLKSGRHNADFYRIMWESINRDGGWQGEVWDRRKNGEVYPKWLTISAVRGDGGAVTHYIGTHFDISERKKAEERINELAFFDQLTGLPNRTLLLDRLKQTMTASSSNGCYGALLFIDLDHFKTLNDTLGHDMGDLLLKQVAQRLTTCVRAGDTIARLGGDEFVVMLASLSMNEAEAATQTETIGETILSVLNQRYQLNLVLHQSTASIGVTLFKGVLTAIDDLMKQAELAMYKSKESGRNALHFFDPHMESTVKERAALENDLRLALEEKQFVLHYQAQVVGNGRVTGAEVLVRWQHSQRGMVSPAEFIPLAEETGLILPLGHWVLEAACTQLASWASRPEMAHLNLAVNISVHQIRQRDFVDQVLAVLKSTGADPQRLKLELTESMLVHNVEETIEKMVALKAKGVGFSLDDFGTGYSSLSYLKLLPLNQLKIDQSFVRNVLTDPNDAAIAKTVVALAQSLGLDVIAEGVELEAQRDFLAGSGCDAYQGYFFSRPLPIAGFEEFAQRV